MRELIKKYGIPILWVTVGAVNASSIWFGWYMYQRQHTDLIKTSIDKCRGSWTLFGESSIIGLRLKCHYSDKDKRIQYHNRIRIRSVIPQDKSPEWGGSCRKIARTQYVQPPEQACG